MPFPESVRALQIDLRDAQRRYEPIFRVVARRDVADLLLEMIDLRRRAEVEIREILGDEAADDEAPSSLIAFVQHVFATVRASIVRGGADSLPALVNDEAQILLAYNNAIDECRPHRNLADRLERQRTALIGMIVKMDRAIFDESDPVCGTAVEPCQLEAGASRR